MIIRNHVTSRNRNWKGIALTSWKLKMSRSPDKDNVNSKWLEILPIKLSTFAVEKARIVNLWWGQLCNISSLKQGIIDSTGTKTFVKEAKLGKLLRELKSTPMSYHKKIHWLFSHVCNGKFAVFLVFCCGITCKWCLTSEKVSRSSGFFVHRRFIFLACVATTRSI